jgi:YD repeat-containing protein
VANTITGQGGLPGQVAGNYGYDEIGNLVRDNSENISAIDWTVYGKVASVTKNTGSVTYLYDAAGQRVAKTANGVATQYIRDASGNTMAIYEDGILKELPIYGSSPVVGVSAAHQQHFSPGHRGQRSPPGASLSAASLVPAMQQVIRLAQAYTRGHQCG